MAKYGEGVGVEFARAVQRGEFQEPFNSKDVKKFVKSKKWSMSKLSYDGVLSKGSSKTHSLGSRKLFVKIDDEKYVLSEIGREK